MGGLGFYNCGPASGASQPRRHMQFIPYAALHSALTGHVRLASLEASVPIDAAIAYARARQGYSALPAQPFQLSVLPFPHAVCMVGGDVLARTEDGAADLLHQCYRNCLAHVFGRGAGSAPGSHNVLLTP
ncbi:hypothetical protein EON67_11100, partial [archaeon]